ncbi:recombinase family protein [Lactococcus formosensis]|uniref:recombinase family protein n=1 Tax=Lactococcus formosensis TaxID=1281486 RepID=UPI00289293A5|nr:recombinase family protein [Lactococcus formosensis]MDT2725973.1 recombinase family protein [Lactococcus formosensis]
MKKVAIYVRVSTLNQAEEGYSISEQTDKLKAYCVAKGWTVAEIYTDAGFTGSNIDRPGMQQLINDISVQKFDTVLIYKLDRLSRSVRDTLYLAKDVFAKNNIDFVSLSENIDTSSAMGGLFLTILSAISEFERETIKERMQLGKLGRAKSGKSMMWSRTAFGYLHNTDTGVLEIEPLQAEIVKQIFQEYLDGMSITKLRDKLNSEGHTGKDKPWSYRALRATLANPVYTGKVKYNNQIFDGLHQAIISPELFQAVQSELEIRQKEAYQKNNNPRPFQSKYILSGIAKCGYCKTPLQVILGSVRKDGSRDIKYQCKNRFPRKTKGVTIYNDNKKCDSGFYYMSDIEAEVIDQISLLQLNNGALENLISINSEPVIDTTEFEKQLINIDNKIKRLSDLYINDMISLDEMKQRSENLKKDRDALKAKITSSNKTSTTDRLKAARKLIGNKPIESLSYEQQKNIINRIISRVYVTAETVDITWSL